MTLARILVLLALALFLLPAPGCNTIEGAGRDIQGAGDAIEDAADRDDD